MTTATNHEYILDESLLNAIARRRLTHGLNCFARPTTKGDIEAVCVDFGLTGRGETVDEARRELEEALEAVFTMANEDHALEDLLNRPDNRAAKWLFHKAQIVSMVVLTILFPLILLISARGWYMRMKDSFTTYEEPAPLHGCRVYC